MTLIYDPLAHWVWGADGWLHRLGALDFAGGTVVHISSGTSALAAVLVIGPRRGFPREPMPPHNLTLTLTGAGLLWFGWFGFNAGSALAANGLADLGFRGDAYWRGRGSAGVDVRGMDRARQADRARRASGAVAGLVAITPASGYVGPMAAMMIGAVAGVLCFFAVRMKRRFGYDDALDVVGVHAVGGIWRRARHRALCQRRRQRGRRRRPVFRQPAPVPDPDRRGRWPASHSLSAAAWSCSE